MKCKVCGKEDNEYTPICEECAPAWERGYKDAIEYVSKIVSRYICHAERLGILDAEFDKQMRSCLRKSLKDEPTTLTAVYLRQLQIEVPLLNRV